MSNTIEKLQELSLKLAGEPHLVDYVKVVLLACSELKAKSQGTTAKKNGGK